MKCLALILASAFCLGCGAVRMQQGDESYLKPHLRIAPPPHLPMLVLPPDRPPGYFQSLPIGVRVIAQPPASSGQGDVMKLLPDSPPSLEELLSHAPASMEHEAEPDSPRRHREIVEPIDFRRA